MTVNYCKLRQVVVPICTKVVSFLELVNKVSDIYVAIHLANAFFSYLNQEQGSEIVHIQVEQATIYIYNFTPGWRARLSGILIYYVDNIKPDGH